MNGIDDLLRDFRAEVLGPADGAHERIFERARRAHAQPAARTRQRRRDRDSRWRWHWRLRWAVVPLAVAATVSLVVAPAPVGEEAGDGSRAAPGLLARA